jgi:hypothetical protein
VVRNEIFDYFVVAAKSSEVNGSLSIIKVKEGKPIRASGLEV